jgi:hypothetical protein
MTEAMNYDNVKNKDDSLNNHYVEANFPLANTFFKSFHLGKLTKCYVLSSTRTGLTIQLNGQILSSSNWPLRVNLS